LFRRVTLFRFFNFPIKADASWLFLSVLMMWTLATKLFPGMLPGATPTVYLAMGFACVIGLFISILAHEVAHGVIAEHYHMPIESITLFIFGGVAEMRGDPSHPKGEFLMALAGPIMSGLLGVFFLAANQLYQIYFPPAALNHVLSYLGALNLMIAAFNMVPAFPLDGGRALRAIIWSRKNNLVLATRIANSLGAAFAYGLLAYACYKIVWWNDLTAGMWWGLIGYFVHAAGAYAVRQTENRSLLGAEVVARFMHDQIVSVSPDIILTELVEKYVAQHYQRIFPVVDKDKLVGVITLQAILALPRDKWHWLHVGSVMEEIDANNTVSPDLNAAVALDMLQRLRKEQLLVAQDGKFLGTVALRDLAAYLSITRRIDYNKPLANSK
jgi:Zn-dependent protease/predicted transcriptional regulator